MDVLDSRSNGHRLPQEVLDRLSEVHPDRVYAAIPRTASIADGFRNVTFKEMRKAIDACATWLRQTVGEDSSPFRTIAYVGPQDLRYPVFFYACTKCQYAPLFISLYNKPHQNARLMRQCDCSILFHATETLSTAKDLQQEIESVQYVVVKPFDEWIASHEAPFPYDKRSFEEAQYDPAVTTHSSGSTGFPKPITESFGFLAACERLAPPVPGRKQAGVAMFNFESDGSFFATSSSFHLSGFMSTCIYPVFSDAAAAVIFPIPNEPLTIKLTKEIITQEHPRLLYSHPDMIEGVAKLPGGMEELKRLDCLMFSGGPLARSLGNELACHMDISQVYGSTETGNAAILLPHPEDWEYLDMHPVYKPHFEPTLEGGISELILIKDPEADPYRPISATYMRDLNEWRTKDLFEPHPSKPGLWRFFGRTDDVIVMSTGEKFSPVQTERKIANHPKISAALMVGSRRPSTALLLQPEETPESNDALIDEVWANIHQANQAHPNDVQVDRSRIAVVEPQSFVKAPKGNVQRSATCDKHSHVIDSLYCA